MHAAPPDKLSNSVEGKVYRVFLSSTAEDLEAHRDRVADVVESMGLLPVRMETFHARAKPPVEECRKLVASCDLAVVMVAHRYGWVPTVEEGGDASKSITWIEVDAAVKGKLGVLAFLVDDKFAWSERREQDGLVTAEDEGCAVSIYRRVRSLGAFKEFLNRHFVRDVFTTPDDLARKVATSLHNWLRQREPDAPARIAGPKSNLPTRPDLIDRETEKTRTLKALTVRGALVVIDGIGGIGKTVLAVEVAHLCLEASRKGVDDPQAPHFSSFVWTSAKDRQLLFEDMLDTIARTLSVPDLTHRPLQDRESSVRRLLSEEPCLIVLDNFEAVSDTRVRDFLVTVPDPSKVLVTTRRQDFTDAWVVPVSGLDHNSAIELVRREAQRLGLKSLANADETKLEPLLRTTGGAPLAIRWAVGQINQRGESLKKVTDALSNARGDVFLEVFQRSWLLLRPHARQALIVMPLFAGPTLRGAIEVASALDSETLDEALGQLILMRLVEVSGEVETEDQRYSIHPLTRAFASNRLKDKPELERSARERGAAWFVSWAQERGGKFAWAKHAELEQEIPNLIAFAQWSHANGLWKQVLGLHGAVYYFLGVRGYWTERLELDRIAVEAAKKIGDTRGQAWTLIDLSWMQIRRHELRDARASAMEALKVIGTADDPMVTLTAQRRVSEIDEWEGHYAEAEEWLKKALVLNKRIAEPRHTENLVRLQQSLGNLYYKMQRLDDARTRLDAAVPLAEGTGADNWRALILSGLANIARDQGRIQDAIGLYEESLALWQRVAQMAELAETKRDFSILLIRTGQKERAAQLLREALRSFQRLGVPQESAAVQQLLEKIPQA